MIFVPGLPASNILRRRPRRKKMFFDKTKLLHSRERVVAALKGPNDPDADDGFVAGAPIERAGRLFFLDIGKQAARLYRLLKDHRVTRGNGLLVAFGWDWRRPVWRRALLARLKAEIESLHADHGRRVVVIAHSTGGLVVRHLLETWTPAAERRELWQKIGHVLCFGVPWAGTLRSLHVLDGRASLGGGLGEVLISRPTARDITRLSWAAYDLLPPDPATCTPPMRDRRGDLNLVIDNGRQISPLVVRDWLPNDQRFHDRAQKAIVNVGTRTRALRIRGADFPVTNVVGWGVPTHVTCQLVRPVNPNRDENFLFNDLADDNHEAKEGDGTIPLRSAAWVSGANVRTFFAPLGFAERRRTQHRHRSLWNSLAGKAVLDSVMRGTAFSHHVFAAADPFDANRDGRTIHVRAVAQDGNARPLPNARLRFREGNRVLTEFRPLDSDGRVLTEVERDRLRSGHGSVLRFEAEVTWDGAPQPVRRALLAARF